MAEDTRAALGEPRRAPGIARHGRLRKPSAARTAAKLVAVVAAVAVVSTGSVAAVAAWDLARTVRANSVDISDGDALPPSMGAIDGGANVLLVGNDSRRDQGDGFGAAKDVGTAELNDVTMLLHISEDHTRATVVSFPRDMLIDRPACQSTDGTTEEPPASGVQINTALETGGLPCVVRTVESITGLEIPYGGSVQFNGVIEMSNAVGGVTVCLANPIKDWRTNLALAAGPQLLQGENAVQFLRVRHGIGDNSDLSRISNQQVFLSALLRTITSTDTLTNPAKLYGIARAAVDNMSLSTSLNNPAAITSLALTVRDIPLDKFTFVQYPTTYLPSGRVAQDVTTGDQMMQLIATDADFTLAPDSTGQGVVLAEPTDPATAPRGRSRAHARRDNRSPGGAAGQRHGSDRCHGDLLERLT
ncbi:LCP family protein [Clavibacter tessellarius]|uniref:LCP family protein n=1 Tax=Clavibacter tessellarius TaxID=31965 RepID=UPI00324EB935